MRQRFANAHNLRKNKKKKFILHVENEFELLKTLYIFTKTIFSHERYRVQLTLIMQLARIIDNRFSTLLTIRYQHIKMILLSNLDNEEQSRMLIVIVFHHIKDYLEKKNAYVLLFYVIFVVASVCVVVANERDKNEFEILDVSNESCLLLCSHIFMLALLFANQVFVALFLTSSKHLFRFRIVSRQKQLSMSLKKKMTKRFLFRRCKSTIKSIQIFEKLTLIDIIFRSQMINLESIIDMKLFTSSYIFRRGNEQALDNNNK